ncbi:unnamed protein product [Caenorhabditis angaria]|uniref:DUF38 domain-containing protein n=1 Tax=Caenorhabditis angaria TaxID=860376 RepID=A0A9P1N462_9PELO|nr:unnamed protein product [Caenorhabditis angaria]
MKIPIILLLLLFILTSSQVHSKIFYNSPKEAKLFEVAQKFWTDFGELLKSKNRRKLIAKIHSGMRFMDENGRVFNKSQFVDKFLLGQNLQSANVIKVSETWVRIGGRKPWKRAYFSTIWSSYFHFRAVFSCETGMIYRILLDFLK